MKLAISTLAITICLCGITGILADNYYGGAGNYGHPGTYGGSYGGSNGWSYGGNGGYGKTGYGVGHSSYGGFSGYGKKGYGGISGYSGYGGNSGYSGYGNKGYSGYGKKGGYIDETTIYMPQPIPYGAPSYGYGSAAQYNPAGSTGIFGGEGTSLALVGGLFVAIALLNRNN